MARRTNTISPRNKIRILIGLILVVSIFLGFLDYPKIWNNSVNWLNNKLPLNIPQYLNVPFRLGLDLQGGTHLVYQADVSQVPGSDQADAVEGVRDVIEKRVNAFGVAEPLVQTTKENGHYRVIVELAGIKDVNEAIKMIGETPLLEFKEQSNAPVELTDEQQQQLTDYNQEAKDTADDILAEVKQNPDQFADVAAQKSEDTSTKDNGGDLGFIQEGGAHSEFYDDLLPLEEGQIYSQVVENIEGYNILKRGAAQEDESGAISIQIFRILVKKLTVNDIAPQNQFQYTGLTGKQLKHAQVVFNPNTNEPQVQLEFNSEGSDLFAEITGRNIGRVVGIFLDGEPISLPTVNEKITGGSAVISGRFSLDEAKILARRLNAGALPVPIELVSQQTVGATLGHESLQLSLEAALLGLILVALFMIIYYRLPGLVSVLALLIYGILVLAVFKLIPVTLTLAGIAGFILSLGMAVDANVLIFERMKEELKEGKPLGSSVEEGFRRAWPSIRDGNFSTLITCVILYWFGTSIIKGFALTLFIGVVLSMLSALFITKTILQLIIGWNFINKINWLFLYKKKVENVEENV